MKHLLALLAWGTLLTGAAGASSIITLESMGVETGPSTVAAGTPAPAAATAEAEPRADSRRDQQPMVIRGGIVGDAFVRAALGDMPAVPASE